MWVDALGWAGSALLIYSVLQARVLRLRLLNMMASLILTAFNVLIEVWPMVAMNVTLAAINLWYIVRLTRHRHDEKAYKVLEVNPHDAYLCHVMRVHAKEIRRFFPHLDWNPGAGDRSAFLVTSGDETVGVMLVRDVGGGVAQVELDYVTPKFRDFTPGEFVYRRSGLFLRRGFRRVLTPPGMVAPYYSRLGFRQEGESYALDLA